MQLLPIIYWSLLGVGILTLFVIIISFITFKVRKKFGMVPSNEISNRERNKKVRVTNPDKLQTEKKHHPKVQTISKQKRNSTHAKTKSPELENDGLYKKPTKETPKKRVEILNQNIIDNSLKSNSSKNDKTKFHSIKVESKKDGWN